MNARNLKHHINWRDAWQEMRKERMGKPKVSYDNGFLIKLQKTSQSVLPEFCTKLSIYE